MGANKRGGAERGSASASTMPPVAKGKAAAADTDAAGADAAGTDAAGNPKDALGKRNVSFTRTRGFFCVVPRSLRVARARMYSVPTPPFPRNDRTTDLVTLDGSGPWVAHRTRSSPPHPRRDG